MGLQLRQLHRDVGDVRSKADLPLAPEVSVGAIPPGTLEVSAIDGTGIEELQQRLARLIGGEEEEFS